MRADFSDGVAKLELDTGPVPVSMNGSLFSTGLLVRTVSHITGKYSGTNAYGAGAIVSRKSILGDGLVLLTKPDAERGELSQEAYTLSAKASGEDARSLIKNARWVIEGTIGKLPNDKLVSCLADYHAPTIKEPTAALYNDCYVGANVNRISLVDHVADKILKSWGQGVGHVLTNGKMDDLTASPDKEERLPPNLPPE